MMFTSHSGVMYIANLFYYSIACTVYTAYYYYVTVYIPMCAKHCVYVSTASYQN